jgi:hypothetical protein
LASGRSLIWLSIVIFGMDCDVTILLVYICGSGQMDKPPTERGG